MFEHVLIIILDDSWNCLEEDRNLNHTSEILTQTNFSSDSKDDDSNPSWPHTLPVDKQ